MSTIHGARLTPPASAWDYGQAVSQAAQQDRAGVLAHVDAVRASTASGASDFDRSGGNTALGSRRMVAVTVALSEPANSPELDWADVIAANLRLLYSGTTVEVIDTWRNDNV